MAEKCDEFVATRTTAISIKIAYSKMPICQRESASLGAVDKRCRVASQIAEPSDEIKSHTERIFLLSVKDMCFR